MNTFDSFTARRRPRRVADGIGRFRQQANCQTVQNLRRIATEKFAVELSEAEAFHIWFAYLFERGFPVELTKGTVEEMLVDFAERYVGGEKLDDG